MHAKNNSLSEATRSLSQGPRQNVQLPATKTDPLPDLMFEPSQALPNSARPSAIWQKGYWLFIHECRTHVNPYLSKRSANGSKDPAGWAVPRVRNRAKPSPRHEPRC